MDHHRRGIVARRGYACAAKYRNGKHAQADRVEITVGLQNGSVFGRITDNGAGFDPALVPVGHMGLSAARERINLAGGAFEITSRPGAGTDLMFRVPILVDREPLGLAV